MRMMMSRVQLRWLRGMAAFMGVLLLASAGLAVDAQAGWSELVLLTTTTTQDSPVGTLSGGEAQRTSLTRALVLEPEILFLDEPFAALDQPTRRRLVRELGELLRVRRMATVFVTHDLAEASALCDRCAVLDAGALLQQEP